VLKSINVKNKRDVSILTQNQIPAIPNHSTPNNYLSSKKTWL